MSHREKLAEETHNVWSSWMKYMFSKGKDTLGGTWVMPKWAVQRWTRQMNTPYSDLSEEEKQSDRGVLNEHYHTIRS